MQAEGNEHGAPIFIGVAIPLSVTGNTLHLAIFGNNIVLCAFYIANLRLSNRNDVIRPVSRQFNCSSTALPHRGRFQIRIWIGVAGKGMLMFLYLTYQHFFITIISMDMR